ncbi:MAG TPA: hypothetical protein ENI07_25770 [Desulfobacterales bacterium]|nr:hypothetical protein [Desulfobacterales bacterium]
MEITITAERYDISGYILWHDSWGYHRSRHIGFFYQFLPFFYLIIDGIGGSVYDTLSSGMLVLLFKKGVFH